MLYKLYSASLFVANSYTNIHCMVRYNDALSRKQMMIMIIYLQTSITATKAKIHKQFNTSCFFFLFTLVQKFQIQTRACGFGTQQIGTGFEILYLV